MLLNFKAGKQSRMLSLSLCLWKNIYLYLVFSAFRDILFIEHYSKTSLSFYSCFKQVLHVIIGVIKRTCIVS